MGDDPMTTMIEVDMADQTNLAFPVLDNIAIACPGNATTVAAFYCDLLGMTIIRSDWLMIAEDQHSEPRLAFDDEPSPPYLPPRWQDPDRPQQVHLDITVGDLDAAERLVLGMGSAKLQDRGAFRTFTDPAGHPFCLYAETDTDSPSRGATGRVARVVVDCAEPRSLAAFYADLLDMGEVDLDTPDRTEIGRRDRLPGMAFQRSDATPPVWPDPLRPQQMHLDIWVEDAQAAGEQAQRLGATRLPEMGGGCAVYADPAGHPFCLCVSG